MATRVKKTVETEPVSLVQTKRTVADLTGDASDAKNKIAKLLNLFLFHKSILFKNLPY